MLSVVKDNASQLLKQFGLEDDMEPRGRLSWKIGAAHQSRLTDPSAAWRYTYEVSSYEYNISLHNIVYVHTYRSY